MNKTQKPNRVSKASCLKNGFTLVELLVVITIIAVLASVTSMVAGRAIAKAHAATCMSNLRQLSTVALVYASDHNGNLPMPENGTETPPVLAWEDSLGPDIGVERDASGEFPIQASIKTCPAQYKIQNSSRTYGYNRQIISNRQGLSSGEGSKRPVTVMTMSRPGVEDAGYWPTRVDTIPMFSDGKLVSARSVWRNYRANSDNSGDENDFPHDGACHMCFLDGHIEAVKKNQGVYNPALKNPVFQDGRPAF